MKRTALRFVTLATLLALLLPAASLAADRASTLRAPVVAENGVSVGLSINEVMFAPTSGGYEWVELKNGTTMPVRPLGYRITDEDGNDYRLPAILPAVPPGAFVSCALRRAGRGWQRPRLCRQCGHAAHSAGVG